MKKASLYALTTLVLLCVFYHENAALETPVVPANPTNAVTDLPVDQGGCRNAETVRSLL